MVPNHKNNIKAFAIYVELASLGAEMFAPIVIGAFLDSSKFLQFVMNLFAREVQFVIGDPLMNQPVASCFS